MSNIEQILRTRIENDEAHTFVVVVPNDAARLKRQRKLISYHPYKAVVDLNVLDIENFVQRLYNQVRPSRQYISPGIQHLWLHELTYPDSHNADISTFRPTQNMVVPDSTLDLIADTINLLREHGETAQDVTIDNPIKVALKHIYINYEQKLGDSWIDEKGKHLYLVNNFEKQYMSNAFPEADLVVVEGFSVLSQADIKILKKIADISEIEMWFRTDCLSSNAELYKNILALVAEFESANVQIDSNFEREPVLHDHFGCNLFTTNSILDDREDFTDQIKVLKPTDRTEEVVQIAHLIQKHVSDNDCNFEDICVTFYDISKYQQRITETFPAYGIPYSLAESVPLTKSEVVKAIFSHLSSDSPSTGTVYFSDFEPMPQSRILQPMQFQAEVENFLYEGEVFRQILNSLLVENKGIVEDEVNALQQFKRIVKELCAVLQSDGNRTESVANYIQKLHYIAKHTHYQSRASVKGESVKIVPLGELRSSEYKIVFLGDLIDGVFPQIYRPDPIVPDSPHRDEDEQLYDNRFLFYRGLKSFCQRLYILSPKRERDAELIPSIFLTQLEAIAEIGCMEITEHEKSSITGFLGGYGNHVWSNESPSEGKFPDKYENMRSLINHVVSVEKSREESHDKLIYEGIVSAEELSPQIQNSLSELSNEVYSVTDLETYAKCPFQYFVGNILRVKVLDEEVEDEPSSLEKGSLLHDVLSTFLINRRDNKDPSIRQCSDEDFDQAKLQLNELLDNKSEARRMDRSDVSVDNLLWKIAIEKQRTALHNWLGAERDYDLPVTPRFFEVSFGRTAGEKDSELSHQNPILIGNVRMGGKIDRIDIGNECFNIIDYKTGSSTIRMQDILEGRSLQLPVYLLITKQLLDEHSEFGELKIAAGLYYKLRLDEFRTELGIGREDVNGSEYKFYNGSKWDSFRSSGQLLDSDLFLSRLGRVNGYINQYVDSIANGNFPLITRVDAFINSVEEGDTPLKPKDPTAPCSYCSYQRVCRVGSVAESFSSDT